MILCRYDLHGLKLRCECHILTWTINCEGHMPDWCKDCSDVTFMSVWKSLWKSRQKDTHFILHKHIFMSMQISWSISDTYLVKYAFIASARRLLIFDDTIEYLTICNLRPLHSFLSNYFEKIKKSRKKKQLKYGKNNSYKIKMITKSYVMHHKNNCIVEPCQQCLSVSQSCKLMPSEFQLLQVYWL